MPKRVSLLKVLRRELGPQLAAEGFTEVSSDNSTLLYFREPARGNSLGFWFQRDVKAGDVDAIGSSFTLEFFRSLSDPYDMDHRERVFFLLTALELEEMRGLENKMIQRLPPLESVYKPWEIKSLMGYRYFNAARQLVSEPYNPNHDHWMRYRDEEDLVAWTSFLARIFPALVERFNVAIPPPA